jgi:hypothetical protein
MSLINDDVMIPDIGPPKLRIEGNGLFHEQDLCRRASEGNHFDCNDLNGFAMVRSERTSKRGSGTRRMASPYRGRRLGEESAGTTEVSKLDPGVLV